MLAASVLDFGGALPEFLNVAPGSVDIEFSEAVLGFDTSDLLLTVDDGSGVQQIEDLSSLTLTTTDGGFHWLLKNLQAVTGPEVCLSKGDFRQAIRLGLDPVAG